MIDLSEPRVTCAVCGCQLTVVPDGRTDDPVGLARRRLVEQCKGRGHECVPMYRAGFR